MSAGGGERGLKRDIGLLGAAFIALNGVIGAGIFATPQAVAEGAGAFSPYFFLIVGLLVTAIAFVMGELAGYFDKAGGPVVYTAAAFGPFVGFQVGWLYYLSRASALAANTNALLTYLEAYLPVDDQIVRGVTIIALFALFVALNIRGVKQAVSVLNAVTFLKVTPLLILVAWGLVAFSGSIPAPTAPQDWSVMGGSVALLVMYAFTGFEQTTLTSGETRDAKRSVPRALVFTVLGMTALYFLIQLAYISIMQGRTPDGAPLAAAGEILAGPWGAAAMTIAAAVSILANLFANLLAAPRTTFAMAQEGTLPAWFGQVHPRFATPANSILALGLLGGVLAVSGAFVWLAVMSSLARIVVYFLCAAAAPRLRGSQPKQQRGIAEQITRIVAPILAAGLCIWAASQASTDAWLFLGAFALVGTALYVVTRWRRRAQAPM